MTQRKLRPLRPHEKYVRINGFTYIQRPSYLMAFVYWLRDRK